MTSVPEMHWIGKLYTNASSIVIRMKIRPFGILVPSIVLALFEMNFFVIFENLCICYYILYNFYF